MARVNADSYPAFVFHFVDDNGDMLKAEADIGALSSGIFNHSGDPFRSFQG